MNVCTLSGNAVNDPELCTSKKGKLFCVFRLAVDGGYRGPNLEREVDFIDCMAFGKQGQALRSTLKKGMRILIRGKIKGYTRIDNVGNKRQRYIIRVSEFEWVDFRRPSNPLEELVDGDGHEIIPREITESMLKHVDSDDEDMPKDIFAGGEFDDIT